MASVAVVGASGYAGALCAAIVDRHPRLDLGAVTARSDAGRLLSDLYPRYRVARKLETFDADRIAEACDAALVAYPHGASGPTVEELRTRGLRVVDLSADFRVPLELYERWYGPHPAPRLIDEAVYGLTEMNREEIRGADLVAAPGCYSTAALLALLPLKNVASETFVDAKSGVSGAGREATETTHYVSVAENVKPYKVEGHRHQAELEAYFGQATFVPHLLPIDQGLMASCYVHPVWELTAEDVRKLFEDAYRDDPFVEVVDTPPGVRDVRDTNLCRIHATSVEGTVLVFSVIDNLWKGAAGQAVQDLNLMLGFDETAGLT